MWPKRQYVSTSSSNGLAPIRRQAIKCTSVNLEHRRHVVSPSHYELNSQQTEHGEIVISDLKLGEIWRTRGLGANNINRSYLGCYYFDQEVLQFCSISERLHILYMDILAANSTQTTICHMIFKYVWSVFIHKSCFHMCFYPFMYVTHRV